MSEDEREQLERQVDEAEERADEARKRAGEVAAREHVDAPIEEYGGDAPEQDPDADPPVRQ